MEDGPITDNYKIDPTFLVSLLNGAMATEYVCYLRYTKHYYMAEDLGFVEGAQEFLEHANQEKGHAEKLAKRISQLGGIPETNPKKMIESSHIEFKECETLEAMLEENLFSERVAVEVYRELIQYIGDKDPTTRRILEEILLMEEEHADDIQSLQAVLKRTNA